MIELKIHNNIETIASAQWNALVRHNNPFVRHEFLFAMEKHHCVGEKFGWIPFHLAIYEEKQLAAVMPLYLKNNSYGEFVFDHSWAQAYQQARLPYFPKLVSAIPYTPAQGQRMLCRAGKETEFFPLFLQMIKELMIQEGASGFHCLFANDQEQNFFESQGLYVRHDCQFHWSNKNYTCFEDFTSELIARKRKNIRKERASVAQAGVTFRRLNGKTASEKDWRDFSVFYQKTFDDKMGMATFNHSFFSEVAQSLPENILLVLADVDGECVAGALMYVSDTTLYGRHWGCTEEIDHLHFETCYYQGIEFCIEKGLKTFEPGAQGEHKIARGFLPVLTRSSHWLASDVFQQPIFHFCQQERAAVSQYMLQLDSRNPYKDKH